MDGRGRETRWKRITEGSLPLAIDGLQPTPIVSGQERVNPYGDALLSSPCVWNILQDSLLCWNSKRRTDCPVFKTFL